MAAAKKAAPAAKRTAAAVKEEPKVDEQTKTEPEATPAPDPDPAPDERAQEGPAGLQLADLEHCPTAALCFPYGLPAGASHAACEHGETHARSAEN